ncbi:uncharacterized protein LOC127844523 isoform X2 [Dreissena polymorpha]|uniref:uncharacterized protein LOC127844523 isoform X2 n=1 Tax=Dreissena polymorpha TaxID=45954 RepID=UPI0022646008|nr:uncharacterized protein LOC127844523 isoform X2 [Dreissena polymorpha]
MARWPILDVRPGSIKIIVLQGRMFRLFTALVLIYSFGCDERIYYEHNNMTCAMCRPGSHWVGHCLTSGASADCVPCPHDQYNPAFNRAIYCKQCRTSCWNQNHEHESVQREEIVQACTGISDLKCQCKEGYWREKGTNNICQRVLTCGQGQGVKTKATPNSDTVCEDCVNGETFSNVSSTTEQCLPCSTCGTDEILHRSCTATEDTICAVRTTTGRKELVIGLVIGISSLVLVFVAIGVGLYVFCYCRSAKTDSDSITKANQDDLQFNVSTHEVVNGTKNRAFQGQRPQANEMSTHVFIDETKANDTAIREQSVKAMVSNACNRGNASGSASEANGASVNDNVSHTVNAHDNENDTEAAIVVNGPKYVDNAYIGKRKAARVIPDGKRAGSKTKLSDASDPYLFLQKVYCELSEKMDGNFRMFFRKNGISDFTISTIEEEEKRVSEQCYKLFRAWEHHINVREVPAMKIPLERIRKLTSMFREDTAMKCSVTCLDILERYENKWSRKCRHTNTRT